MTARVSQLVRYPVKGCSGQALDRVRVDAAGLADDRLFMLVDEDGKFLSQRRKPEMATIAPWLLDDGRRLELRAPGAGEHVVDVLFDGERLAVNVFAWSGKGIDQGTAIAGWLSEVLGQRCRLVRVPPDHDRVSAGAAARPVGFADGTGLLVTSESSLDDLNRRIETGEGKPVPMNRFRPNLVVAGWPEPYTEDGLRELTAGGVHLGFERIATRCAVPTVEQTTGRRGGREPIWTLAGYRRDERGKVCFGVGFGVLTPGVVAVGDPVHHS